MINVPEYAMFAEA